jgi:hypothetical protein
LRLKIVGRAKFRLLKLCVFRGWHQCCSPGKNEKPSVLIHGGGSLDFVKLMYRSSHDVFSARPRFEVGEAVRTRSGSDRGINIVGKQTQCRVFGLVLLALVFMQFPVLATTTSVTLAWNPSTDSTIAGYNIYYGGVSHIYTNKISVGKATSVTISGLVQGITYYFAATTYSTSGLESALSGELVYLVPANVPIVNQPPTLDAIRNLTITENAGLHTVSLSDVTSGSTTENQTLVVTAASSDTSLIPNPSVNYTNGKATGSLTFTPMHNATGTAIITVTVNDGQARNNTMIRTFTVTVVTGRAHHSLINPLTNLVAMVGQTNTFRATTTKANLSYQWKFNGTNQASATGPALTLNKITTNQAGIYSVTATDGHVSTSRAATLTVYGTAAAKLVPATHASGQYALAVAGVTGYKYVIQASTNLVNWVPMQTNTAPFTFVDANAGKFRQRYYRSVYAP